MALRLAIVGTGSICEVVAPQVGACGWEISAIASTPRSFSRARELCERLGGVPFDSYETMFAEAKADAVYVAVPNHLHFEVSSRALDAGFNVICEKPLCSNVAEARALAERAQAARRLLFEAVMPLHLPNFAKLCEWLPRVGEVRIVTGNFSQYSRRYDAFRRGEVLPAFDPAKSGGALMDLGLYNLHWAVGLFGAPERATYAANVERGIDTSGIATLDYGSFKASLICAKDCQAPASYCIEGTKGYLLQSRPASLCGPVTLHLNDGTEETFDGNPATPYEAEFRDFARIISEGDEAEAERLLAQSLAVAAVQTEARLSAGVRFPSDEKA